MVEFQKPAESGARASSVAVPQGAGANVSLEAPLRRLAELAQLDADWDTYGGMPPTQDALAAARRLVEDAASGSAAGEQSLPYHVAPIADGGVGLEWRAGEYSLEVWVGSGGSLGYLLARGTGEARRFQEADGVSRQDVLRVLREALDR